MEWFAPMARRLRRGTLRRVPPFGVGAGKSTGIALFGVIVGIALLLSGIGFIILALVVLGKHDKPAAASA